MRKMTADEIRDMWLAFFKSKGHFIEPSANLIPVNDPTLLWINAGVAALKKYFDGSERPEHRRITNAQKCIRTNDIENVGHTARHHTFFEMLGNFSIGDYFRPEVIPWACELLMGDKWFAFPKEKLYVTYYPDDEETKNLWIKNGMLEDHLVPLKSNFWEIGEGPCGPDTEIYFDRGEKWDPNHIGDKLLRDDMENDRYIEIWNIVFSQFNAQPGTPRDQYKELPQKNIDTGAGLERFACVIQEADTNFDTDLFTPTIEWIKKHSPYPYEGKYLLAYRVIADHIRSVTFALADGASFSNEGRGYVLRRLVRRAVRYANALKLPTGSLSELVGVVTKTMDHYYPYLDNEQSKVAKMILAEEQRFEKTLHQGENLLSSYLEKSGDMLSGEDAFRLSDTYGFPIELTVEIASEQGKKVDMEGFKKELAAQKERARAARGDRESFKSQSKDLLAFTLPSEFTYETKPLKSKVIGCFKDGVKVDSIDDEGDIILAKTDFYAESGGQVADKGEIDSASAGLKVLDVQKAPNKQYLHHVEALYGTIKEGDEVELHPDFARRDIIRKNHSSCHLFQAALQKFVSKDCHQAGSYVDDEMMRFDFTCDRKLTDEELEEIEREVNLDIQKAIPCETKIMPIEEAKKTGAMALFNEKYGSEVRVVSFEGISKEFCAGTHVANTKDIGLYVIVSEQALAAGIRRVVGYTGLKAYEYLKSKEGALSDIAAFIGVKSDKEIITKLKAMQAEKDNLKARISALEGSIVAAKLKQIIKGMQKCDGFNLYVDSVSGFNHDQLAEMIKTINVKDSSSLVILFDSEESSPKGQIGVGLGLDVIQAGRKAGQIVKELATRLNGSGGGKPDLAFGGFTAFDQIEKTISALGEIL
ncbi:MAG: alanine--tRNA ligase [Bacilli bacterium]|jgi:alanyl-tRNA synthetase|nr:alanine--tRNA ligase [Bacilli bacterium]